MSDENRQFTQTEAVSSIDETFVFFRQFSSVIFLTKCISTVAMFLFFFLFTANYFCPFISSMKCILTY